MSRSAVLVVVASLGAVVIAVVSSGGVFSDRGSADGATPVAPSPTTTVTVLGVTVTRPTSPAVTVTTVDAFAAALAAATPPPGSTTSATTVTTSPAPSSVAPGSASAAAPGVTLLLESSPAAAGRSVDLRLAASFHDARVLRSARIDLGDGTVVDGAVEAWACGAPAAPNPYVLTVPTHTYRAGSYTVIVSAATAACSPDDDDWGPDEPVEVRLSIAVP